QGRQALCFAVTVAHAEHLADAFNRRGVRAAVVSGETAPEERRRLLYAYERGELTVLCNCGVLTEGYDAPVTSCVILARPTKSRALFTQCIGRGTRLAPGKHDCIILDVTDNCLKHRLQPMTLSQALGTTLLNGESVIEAKAREQREVEEREPQERTTRVLQRAQDLAVNILARMDWKRRKNGLYTLEVGEKKHRILLVPSEDTEGYYSVWAKLAPDFKSQRWLKASPLDWAQQHAEMKARLLQTDERKLVLVDSNAPWRAKPASAKQLLKLRQFGIPLTENLTCGEASDLIGHAIAQRQQRQAEGKITKEPNTKKARASA
ncbi:MAG: hypothetical protein J2P37_32225, partial [Ktedonobacteraceae bacterium]|nr:hypothetical protein [Ktedonobacteraceae bacterium]